LNGKDEKKIAERNDIHIRRSVFEIQFSTFFFLNSKLAVERSTLNLF